MPAVARISLEFGWSYISSFVHSRMHRCGSLDGWCSNHLGYILHSRTRGILGYLNSMLGDCLALFGRLCTEQGRCLQFWTFARIMLIAFGDFNRPETYLTHRLWCRQKCRQTVPETTCHRRNSTTVVRHRQGMRSLNYHPMASGSKNSDQSRKYQVMPHPRGTYLMNHRLQCWEASPR